MHASTTQRWRRDRCALTSRSHRLGRRGLAAAVTLAAGLAAPAMAGNCPADFAGAGGPDGEVGFSDLTFMLAAWGTAGSAADLDGSGLVDFGDLTALLAAWGPCPGDPDPVIKGVFPEKARPGEVITVVGENFGFNPDNLCMAAGDVGFRVLAAHGDRLEALVLPFPEDAQPGPIGIAVGEGVRDFPVEIGDPDFGGVEEPVWCWGQAPDGPMVIGGFNFVPVPGQFPGDETVPSVLVDGGLEFDLSDISWEPGDKLRIVARLWCDERHIDCVLPTFRIYENSPTPESCAISICLLIMEAYQQLGVDLDCTLLPGPIVRMAYPDCEVQEGISLTSQIVRTRCPFGEDPDMQLQQMEPPFLVEGEIVTIMGQGFDTPLDLCAVMIGGPSIEPLTVIGNRLIARVGPIAPGMEPGPVMVARGRGTVVQPDQFFIPGITIGSAADGFQGLIGAPNDAVLQGPFDLGGPNRSAAGFQFDPASGTLVACLETDWNPGDTIRADVHFNVTLPDGSGRHYDCFADDVVIPTTVDPDTNACAQLICQVITQTFANQSPPVDIDCNVDGNKVIITVPPSTGTLTSGGGTALRVDG
ncbi:MAG: GC-type dockerin domain-anchored protein [Phycisphaerales bacterium]